jgi:hypothetical protein
LGRSRAEQIAALRLGLDLGMSLIDTAEMYGNGAAEELTLTPDPRAQDQVLGRQQLRSCRHRGALVLQGGAAAVTDQVLHNLARRAIEWDLLPWCRVPPADHGLLDGRAGQLLAHPVLQSVAG